MNNAPLTTLLIDDEEDCRIALRNFISKYCAGLIIVAEADSVERAVPQIKMLKPDLVFLDINMPHQDGFALFESIPDPEFYTIFVTAYDAYALRAIKHHALDYLLKPVNITELIHAVERAKALYHKKTLNQQIGALLSSAQKTKVPEKVCIPLTDGFIYVKTEEIIRCEAEGNYTTFYFTNRPKIIVCRTLGSYELLFSDHGFARVHNQHLINLVHVEQYQRGRGGMVLMSDKKQVMVAQRRKDDFLRLIHNNAGVQDGIAGD